MSQVKLFRRYCQIMNEKKHCPYRQTKNLQDSLTSGKMKVAFMLGAGCPVSIRMKDGNYSSSDDASGTSPLIPDIAGLTRHVKIEIEKSKDLKDGFSEIWTRLGGDEPNCKITIEDILSHIRSLQDVIREGVIGGLNKLTLAELDSKICAITTGIVNAVLPVEENAYRHLAAWIGDGQHAHAVEIFTPNYDLLLEQGLEAKKIPYFDGFVGSKQAFFDLATMEAEKAGSLPERWARLWKLHGSINWWRVATDAGSKEFDVVRGEKPENADQQMIYPSHLKYDQSRRMPYLAMLDRLRSFLNRGQVVLVVCGYSFLDQHLNEVLLQGLRSNPSAICFGLLFSKRSDYSEALKKAKQHHNLTILAKDGAVIGRQEADWSAEEQTNSPFHGMSVMNSEFQLGDFKKLGEFLSQQLSLRSFGEGESDAK